MNTRDKLWIYIFVLLFIFCCNWLYCVLKRAYFLRLTSEERLERILEKYEQDPQNPAYWHTSRLFSQQLTARQQERQHPLSEESTPLVKQQ